MTDHKRFRLVRSVKFSAIPKLQAPAAPAHLQDIGALGRLHYGTLQEGDITRVFHLGKNVPRLLASSIPSRS